MKISQIAARLHKVASDLDAGAETSDYDFPDDMVLPLIKNAFVDDNVVRSFVVDLSKSRGGTDAGGGAGTRTR
jgi:hypothetical protein